MPPTPPADPNAGPAAAGPARPRRSPAVLAAVFVGGLLVGGLLVGAVAFLLDRFDDARVSASEPAPTVTVTAPATPSDTGSDLSPTSANGSLTVTIPSACVESTRLADELLTVTRRATDALSDLDLPTLRTVVVEIQALEPQVRDAVAQCRAATGQG